MELGQMAEIIQGNNPTRIEKPVGIGTIGIDVLTMQELNFVINDVDIEPQGKIINVEESKYDTFAFTRINDIVIVLSSGKTMVIDEARAGKIILSNLAIIRLNNISKIDPYFLCWYFNNNTTEIKKRLQGKALVSIIPITELKKIDIAPIPINRQRQIGKIYELNRKRERIQRSIAEKQKKILVYQLNKAYEKENINGKE